MIHFFSPQKMSLFQGVSTILLRTVQRRVKVWRREKATAMVFGELPDADAE